MTKDTGSDDPFAVLEDAAKKQDAIDKVHQRVSKARTRLVLSKSADYAFWATLALRLKVEIDEKLDTCATDGKHLIVDPTFFAGLSEDERVGVIAHEVAHCAHKHITRLEKRDMRIWNVAADLVVNPMLKDAGFKLPQGGLMPGVGDFKHIPKGLSTEATYSKLLDMVQSGEWKPGEGTDPGGCGGVMVGKGSDTTEAGQKQMENEWDVAVGQAANAAKQRGNLCDGIKRLVIEATEPKVNWREVLREFVTKRAKNDYSWSPPNRRFIHAGIYLPSTRSEELGEIVMAIDTSGSIDDKTMAQFAGEVQGIIQNFPTAKLTILYHHVPVYAVQTWSPEDGPLRLLETEAGGTDHRPVFEKIKELGLDPTCLVCLTDMCSMFPRTGPDYPVIWCSIDKGTTAPFGQLLEIEL